MKPTTSAAAAAGLAAPDRLPNPEKQTPAVGAGAAGEQGRDSSGDSAEAAELVKRLARLQAELALQGVELHALKSGGLLAVGAGVRAHFGDLAAAEAWSRQRTASAGAGARFDALRARLQAAGWILSAGGADGFTVARWGQLRHLADFAAVEGFARQVGVKL